MDTATGRIVLGKGLVACSKNEVFLVSTSAKFNSCIAMLDTYSNFTVREIEVTVL
jgi:hypothetical protein